IRDLACKRIFYINKEGFLLAFKDAFFKVFTEQNCCKAFEASGLVLLKSQVELEKRLEIRLRTLLALPSEDTLWQSKTLSNTLEF
ncbi:hypothetical protein EJ02DRAFT_323708, partial [Clathrospora elynae]